MIEGASRFKRLRVGVLLVVSISSFVSAVPSPNDVPEVQAPIRQGLDPTWHIPPFQVWRRIFREEGDSHYKRFSVGGDGTLKVVEDPRNQGAAYRRMRSSSGKSFAAGAETWMAPGSRSPNGRWEAISIPPENNPAGVRIALADHRASSTVYLVIPSHGELRFGGGPTAWGSDDSSVYVRVYQGPTGARDQAFFDLDLPPTRFLKIGDMGENPVISPDGNWLVWFGHLADNGAGWMTVGGKHVAGSHLLIYSVRHHASCQLSHGIEDVQWGGWEGELPIKPGDEVIQLPLRMPTDTEREEVSKDIAGLKSDQAVERAQAARDLARLRGAAVAAVPALITALGDPEWSVQAAAADAIFYVAIEARDQTVPAMGPLTQLLKSHDGRTTRSAGEALGVIGPDQSVIHDLSLLLNDPDTGTRVEAASALGRARVTATEAIPGLMAGLDDSDQSMRMMSWNALGRIGKAAIPTLTVALNSPKSRIRTNALCALSVMAQVHPNDVQAAVPDIRRRLRDDNDHVQDLARRVLEAMPDAEGEAPAR